MSNNTRAPTKDEVRAYYETHNISLKKLAEYFSISENTVKSWKARDKKNGYDWVQPESKKVATMGAVADDRKKAINEARIKVISGSTIKAAAEETGVKESTLQNYSVKEKWIEKQKAFNQYLFNKLIEEKGEQHIERRTEAIEFLNYIQRKTMKKLGEDELLKDDAIVLERATNIVLKTMKGQAELLGMLDIKLSEKLENKTEEEKIQSSDRAIIVKVVD